MTKSITICALVVGLIGLFTAVAWGQQAGPAQPPAAGMIAGSSQDSAGGPSESDVAKANNSSESRWRSWERFGLDSAYRSLLARHPGPAIGESAERALHLRRKLSYELNCPRMTLINGHTANSKA